MKNHLDTIFIFTVFLFCFQVKAQNTITVNGTTNNLSIDNISFEVLSTGSPFFINQTAPTGNTNPTPINVPVNIFSLDVNGITNTQAPNKKIPTLSNFNSLIGSTTAPVDNIRIISPLNLVNHRDAGSTNSPAADNPPYFTSFANVVSIADMRSYFDFAGGTFPSGSNNVVDVVYDDPFENNDIIVVTERDGNSTFTLVPLDQNGNPVPNSANIIVDGYQWNTNIQNDLDPNGTQPQNLVAFSADLFFNNGNATTDIYGYRIVFTTTGGADGKVLVFKRAVDVGVNVTVDDDTPTIGQAITFTIEAVNNGPGPTTNVIVENFIPSGLNYVSDNGGTAYNSSTGVWSVGDLLEGQTATLQLTVQVNSLASFPLNLTSFIESDFPDIVRANDSSTQSLNTDFDNDGVFDGQDIDSDNDGILDSIECDFNSTQTFASLESQIGVTNAANAAGLPNATFAQIYQNSDRIILDFGQVFPAGTTYEITWKVDSGSTGTATIDLSESTLPGTGFIINPIPPSTNSQSFVTSSVTSNSDFRYLLLSKGDISAVDYDLDAIGVFNFSTTCIDSDGDGIEDRFDLDSDNDGIPDNIEAQTTLGYLAPLGTDSDNDGLDDAYDANDSDTSTTASVGLLAVNTDGTDNPDYLDLDSDNDGFFDIDESGDGLTSDGNGQTTGVVGNNGLDNTVDNGGNDNYADVNGKFDDTQSDNFTDDDNDVNTTGDVDYRDTADTDGDGIADNIDLDDDNDGIPDLTETGGVDPLADTDGDGIPAYLDDNDNDDTVGNTDNAIEPAFDSDGDGTPNHLDLDSDNDGIPDNVEAQTTQDYIAPSGNDDDNDGLDNAYDDTPNGNSDGSGSNGLFPVNTDGTDNPDYLDLDSDNDGLFDIVESGLANNDTDNDGRTNSAVGINGLDNDASIESSDNYSDVNAIAYNNATNTFQLADSDFDTVSDGTNASPTITDLDYRDDSVEPDLDSDEDGIPDATDLDDDNDGILDVDEQQCTSSPATLTSDGQLAIQASNGLTGTSINVDDNNTAAAAATFNAVGDYLIVDLGRIVPVGESITVIRTNNNTNGNRDYIAEISEVPLAAYINGGGDNQVSFDRGSAGTISYTLSQDTQFIQIEQVFQTGNQNPGFDITEVDYSYVGSVITCIDIDSDGDGIFDRVDLDADNDGIPDIIEAGGVDTNNDGRADNTTDSDNDGWVDTFDPDDGGVVLADVDSDLDGISDRLDLDSDNDGVTDIIESGGVDADGNGEVDNPLDTDTDGWANTFDSDDGGTALDNPDSDNDGFVDRLDLDSDNDGITDITEAGGAAFDADGDGVADDLTDTDNDGLADTFDTNNVGGTDGTALDNPDTDGDGLDNRIDIDADDDGIADNIEAQTTPGYIPPTGLDTDNDGIDDAYDVDCTPCGATNGVGIIPVNTDTLDNSDYLDLDSDNDGETDYFEAYDTDGNNSIDGSELTPSGTDTDGDGLDDSFDLFNLLTPPATGFNAANTNQTPNSFPNNDIVGGEPNWREIDTDEDGVADVNDLDDDNDGILDVAEGIGGNNPVGDEDGDGILNYLDVEDNGNAGDSSVTDYTDSNSDGIPDVFDADNDGIPNHLDLDADNDGIPDNIEAQTTAGYTSPNADDEATFRDNDGVNTAYLGGLTPVDTDGDTTPDYLDSDSDDDGLTDLEESFTTTPIPSNGLGANGLSDDAEAADDYTDVNGNAHDGTNFTLLDTDGDMTADGSNALPMDTDFDYRDDNSCISLNLKVYLAGALINNGAVTGSGGEPLMRDNLRNSIFETSTSYLPTLEPYTALAGFTQVGSGGGRSATATAFDDRGQNSVVDWVFIEFRDKNDNTSVLETMSALVQRDGDVVDIDGVSPIELCTTESEYFVAVRHRNHLGVMTALAEDLKVDNTVDFSDNNVGGSGVFNYGTSHPVGGPAGFDYTGLSQQSAFNFAPLPGGVNALWAGNSSGDDKIKFESPDDDLNTMLFSVLLFPGNSSFQPSFDFALTYDVGDLDMNGKVKFESPDDDQNFLLFQVLLHPLNNTFQSSFDFIFEQLP